MPRIAVIGAGNLGSYLATQLHGAGHEVFFCVKRPPDPGLGIRYYIQNPPRADLAILTVKVHQTSSASVWFPHLQAPIAVVQNGVHHEDRVRPYSAIPVLSYVYVENGRAFTPPREHFTVPSDASANLFADRFAHTPIMVRREPDFHTAAWRKCLHNCVSNPLTALAGRGLEILREPLYRGWAERILAEALPIAQADGAKLSDNEPILEILASYPPGTRTSMLQDREQGKRLELDALNGTLVELGRVYGLPTRVNEDLIARLSPS